MTTNNKPADPDSSSPKKQWQWFRFYHETMRDRKVRTLTHAEFRLWAAVQTCASESPVRGFLLTPDGPASTAYLADLAGVSKKCAADGMAKFAAPERRMLTWCDEMTCWQVRQWDKRQFESDSSTERTRAWRERHQLATCDVPGDVPVTAPGTRTEVRGQSPEDLAIASTGNSSPLSVVRDLEDEPPNHTAALNLLATRDMHERLRDQPDLTPIKYEIPWLMKTAQRRRVEFAHVLARLAPDLDVSAIIQEIDAADPHRRGEQPRWACTCEGSGMIPADTGFVLCPDCENARRTA